MKTIVFNKKDYRNYKDFYKEVYNNLVVNSSQEWTKFENLHYNADFLYEFLRDYLFDNKNINFIFTNFDNNELKNTKSNDDYNYSIVFNIFKDLKNEFSNIKIDFQNDDR